MLFATLFDGMRKVHGVRFRNGGGARRRGGGIALVLCPVLALLAAACSDDADDTADPGTPDTQFGLLETRGMLVVGQSVAASLTATDLPLEAGRNRRVVAWEMAVDSGQQVQIDIMSDAFNPFLYVEGPGIEGVLTDNDSGSFEDARLCFRAPVAGSYKVVAAAYRDGVGDYSLGALNGCDGIPARFRELAPRGLLAVGQSIAATLTDTDRPLGVAQNRRATAWEIRVDSGQQVQIELTSEAFDPFLYIVGPGMASPLEDDDGGGGLDARLCLRAPDAATYRIIASGPAGGGVGDYSLSALDGCFGTARLNQLDSRGVLAVGRSVAATLADTVPPLDGRHPVAWEIQVDSGQQVQIDVMSDEFDPYLYLVGPGMAFALTDDDSGSGRDARLCFDAPDSTTYRIVAAALDGETGDPFVVSVQDGCGGASARPALWNRQGVLALGATIAATLSDTDLLVDSIRGVAVTEAGRLVVDGPRAVAWEIRVDSVQEIQIDMTSDAFDPLLNVVGPGLASLARDDDGGILTDAHVCFAVPEEGSYTVVAAAQNGGVGAYRLSARGGGCDGIPARLEPLRLQGSLGVGRSTAATLTSDHLAVSLGHFAAVWDMQVERDQEVQIDMVSDAFSPFFYIVGPGMPSRYSEDAGGDATLCARAPDSGSYRIVAAASREARAVGDYWLRARDGCSDIPARLDLVEVRGAVAIGESIDDVLTTTDFSVEPGRIRRGVAWELDLRRGQEVQIEMVSEAVNPFLYLVGPGMADPLTNDDGGLGWNARLCFRALDSGTHRVVAAALDGGVGDYALTALAGCPADQGSGRSGEGARASD